MQQRHTHAAAGVPLSSHAILLHGFIRFFSVSPSLLLLLLMSAAVA